MAAPLLCSLHADDVHEVAQLAYKLQCANVSNLICVVVRVRPIPVSGIGPATIPVALSFVYLSQQSTLLQCMPIVSSLYRIFAHIPRIHI